MPTSPHTPHRTPEPGEERDLHIWKHPEDDHMVATYTFSIKKRALCHHLPIEDALNCLREYLEQL